MKPTDANILNEPKRKRWTPAEDLKLKRYFAYGCYTSAEIAEKLGRKKSAVDARKNKLGLTRTKLSAKNPCHRLSVRLTNLQLIVRCAISHDTSTAVSTRSISSDVKTSLIL